MTRDAGVGAGLGGSGARVVCSGQWGVAVAGGGQAWLKGDISPFSRISLNGDEIKPYLGDLSS